MNETQDELSFLRDLDIKTRDLHIVETLTTPEALLEEIVAPQEAGFSIHDLGYTVNREPTQVEVPSHLRAMVPIYLEPLETFVQGVFVTDTFGQQHREQRVPWEEKQTDQVRDVLSTNRIGRNNIGQKAIGYFSMLVLPNGDFPSFWSEVAEANPERSAQFQRLEQEMSALIEYFDDLQEVEHIKVSPERAQETVEHQAQQTGKTLDELLGDLSFQEYMEQVKGFTWDEAGQQFISPHTQTIDHYNEVDLDTQIRFTQAATETAREVLDLFGYVSIPRAEATAPAA